MNSRKLSNNSSDGSQDTDVTNETDGGVKNELTWRDFAVYYHFLTLFIIFFVCWYLLNRNVLVMIWYIYVFVPIVDVILKLDHQNLTNEKSKKMEKDKRFLIPLYLYIVLDLCIWVWSMYMFSTGSLNGLMEKIQFTLVIGNIGSLGMVIGHELLHRYETVHKIAGTWLYVKMMYGHFFIEHIKGHHKHVSTPLDPASSQKGESLYEFLPRTIVGGYESVWKYETQRLARKPKPEGSISINNRLIGFVVLQIVILAAIYSIFGLEALIFALAYAAQNILFQETINYLEHYGLSRKMDENGVYEPVSIKHSWNAPQRYTNYLLFKLQRHSDHHANAHKPYQVLNSFEDSPTLPNGYSASLITALVPSVWFKAIDPLVDAYNDDRKLTKQEQQQSKTTIN
jgi:alkane 1-monooxygenase